MGFYTCMVHVPKEEITPDMLEYATLREKNLYSFLISKKKRENREIKQGRTLRFISQRLKKHYSLIYVNGEETLQEGEFARFDSTGLDSFPQIFLLKNKKRSILAPMNEIDWDKTISFIRENAPENNKYIAEYYFNKNIDIEELWYISLEQLKEKLEKEVPQDDYLLLFSLHD